MLSCSKLLGAVVLLGIIDWNVLLRLRALLLMVTNWIRQANYRILIFVWLWICITWKPFGGLLPFLVSGFYPFSCKHYLRSCVTIPTIAHSDFLWIATVLRCINLFLYSSELFIVFYGSVAQSHSFLKSHYTLTSPSGAHLAYKLKTWSLVCVWSSVVHLGASNLSQSAWWNVFCTNSRLCIHATTQFW